MTLAARESAPGIFEPARQASGRVIGSRGRDILLSYTPIRSMLCPAARGHLWVAEWQAVGWDRGRVYQSWRCR